MNDDPAGLSGSMLDGLDTIIDTWLGIAGDARYGTAGIPAYYSRTAAIDLSISGDKSRNGASLVGDLLERIDANWRRMGSRPPSPATWRWQKSLHITADNTAEEKLLEKAVVQLLGDDWSNQIPTCNGMAVRQEYQRCIDLGHRVNTGEFEMIELKYGSAEQRFGSNQPLYAAFEILLYGLLYVHARQNVGLGGPAEKRELLRATGIHLQTLAPTGFYSYKTRAGDMPRYEFCWLEKALNAGLTSLALPFTIDFQFWQLTSDFDDVYLTPQPLAEAMGAFRRMNMTAREGVCSEVSLPSPAPSPTLLP